jgi:hypothetical protein
MGISDVVNDMWEAGNGSGLHGGWCTIRVKSQTKSPEQLYLQGFQTCSVNQKSMHTFSHIFQADLSHVVAMCRPKSSWHPDWHVCSTHDTHERNFPVQLSKHWSQFVASSFTTSQGSKEY